MISQSMVADELTHQFHVGVHHLVGLGGQNASEKGYLRHLSPEPYKSLHTIIRILSYTWKHTEYISNSSHVTLQGQDPKDMDCLWAIYGKNTRFLTNY